MNMEEKKCLAAVLYGPEDMRIEQVDVPSIGPNDALIQMKACALCGSDLSGYLGKHGRVVYPRILGHEFSGVIAKLGQKVTGFSEGQRVCCDPDIRCGTCDLCRQGRGNLCVTLKTQGFDIDGAYSEYVKVHQDNLYPIPDNTSFEDTSLVQTLGVAYSAVKRRGEVLFNDYLLIIGCGPIGLSSLLFAKAAGAYVIITDTVGYRLEMAKELGADEVINAENADIVESVLRLTQGKGVDKVIEAVGGQQDVTLRQCTQAVKRGGLVVLVGTFAGNKATLRATEFKDRELEMRGSRAYIGWYAFPEIIQLIASGKINVSRMITHRLKLAEAEKGLKLMQDKQEKVMKVVISP
jgi:L-iditol 2-dehydrogenase